MEPCHLTSPSIFQSFCAGVCVFCFLLLTGFYFFKTVVTTPKNVYNNIAHQVLLTGVSLIWGRKGFDGGLEARIAGRCARPSIKRVKTINANNSKLAYAA